MPANVDAPFQVTIKQCQSEAHHWWLAAISEHPLFAEDPCRVPPKESRWCGIFPTKEQAERAAERALRELEEKG